jgi:prepilin signal peptidase PulO-like enzyme (type II secretory pathway)
VVIFRHNTGKSTIKGHSMCLSCSKKLSWYELIPLFSFLAQGGRCRNCKSKISIQYPVVEGLTAFFFILLFYRYGWLLFAGHTALFFFLMGYLILSFALLLVIAVYDLRHKIIPNGLVYSFIALSVFSYFFHTGMQGLISSGTASHIFAGIVTALPFAGLWFFSKGKAMGFGDAKLALGMGFFLGLSRAVAALALSFWLGALISVGIILIEKSGSLRKKKQLTMKSEIPFAPFLIAGFFLAYFLNIDVSVIASWFM